MRVIAIIEKSNGNATVGEMWKEAKIFESDSSLEDVIRWAGSKRNVTLVCPDNDSEEWSEIAKQKVKLV